MSPDDPEHAFETGETRVSQLEDAFGRTGMSVNYFEDERETGPQALTLLR